MLRRDAANNNNSATTNIPQRLRDNVQAGCRQQLSSKAGRRQFIRVVKAGCRQQLSSKAGSRQLVRADKAEFCQRIRAIVAILNTNMCQNVENNNEIVIQLQDFLIIVTSFWECFAILC